MPAKAFRILAMGAIMLGAGMATPAMAQSPCTGRLSANAFAPVARNAAVTVPDQAGTENERRLRDAVLGALRTAGRPVRADAPYILSWRGGVSAEGDNFGGFSDTLQDRTFRDSDDLSWALDVPRMGGRRIPTLRVSGVVELRERASGRVVWSAVLTCTRHGTDDEALFGHLANAVAPLLGQPVAGRPF